MVQRLAQIVAHAFTLQASDVHLKTGFPTVLRLPQGLTPLKDRVWTGEELEAIVEGMLTPEGREYFVLKGEADTTWSSPEGIRLRVNCYRERGKPGLALRLVPSPPKLEDLGLSDKLASFTQHKDGLVIIAGPTGSGKSTTLAGLIGQLNSQRFVHIVTIEDPVEFIYEPGEAMITQREVGSDTTSFSEALRRVLRQDPDVIVIGECRDAETMKAAISAAETGHLVFTTLHAVNVKETVGRVLEMFPSNQHQQIRHLLAGVLRGVIAQRLLPGNDGKRVALQELLVGTNRVSDALRDPDKTAELDLMMEAGEVHGMQTFNQALVGLVSSGKISVEVALDHSHAQQNLRLLLQKSGGHTMGGSGKDEPRFELE